MVECSISSQRIFKTRIVNIDKYLNFVRETFIGFMVLWLSFSADTRRGVSSNHAVADFFFRIQYVSSW